LRFRALRPGLRDRQRRQQHNLKQVNSRSRQRNPLRTKNSGKRNLITSGTQKKRCAGGCCRGRGRPRMPESFRRELALCPQFPKAASLSVGRLSSAEGIRTLRSRRLRRSCRRHFRPRSAPHALCIARGYSP